MKKTNSAFTGIFLTFIFAFVCGLQPALGASNVYKTMADDIAKFSKTNKVKSIAVLAFTRKARTSREESEYVSERLLTCLAASGKVKLLERNQLDKVLQEQRLGLAGVTKNEDVEKKDGAISSADVIIIGVVFGTADHLKIIAKMIDSETGTVLHVIEAQTEREWDMLTEKEGFEFDVPDMSVLAQMFNEDAQVPAFNDFRDAPNSLGTGECGERKARLLAHQGVVLEAKAKYWALRMRDPQFSNDNLTRNPGGEIADQQLKKKFYELLYSLHKAPDAPVLSQAEEQSVKLVMDEEKQVSNDCGLH